MARPLTSSDFDTLPWVDLAVPFRDWHRGGHSTSTVPPIPALLGSAAAPDGIRRRLQAGHDGVGHLRADCRDAPAHTDEVRFEAGRRLCECTRRGAHQHHYYWGSGALGHLDAHQQLWLATTRVINDAEFELAAIEASPGADGLGRLAAIEQRLHRTDALAGVAWTNPEGLDARRRVSAAVAGPLGRVARIAAGLWDALEADWRRQVAYVGAGADLGSGWDDKDPVARKLSTAAAWAFRNRHDHLDPMVDVFCDMWLEAQPADMVAVAVDGWVAPLFDDDEGPGIGWMSPTFSVARPLQWACTAAPHVLVGADLYLAVPAVWAAAFRAMAREAFSDNCGATHVLGPVSDAELSELAGGRCPDAVGTAATLARDGVEVDDLLDVARTLH